MMESEEISKGLKERMDALADEELTAFPLSEEEIEELRREGVI